MVHRLSRRDARRVAIRAQLLQRDRPTELLPLVRRLTLLQLSPTNAVAPSADLVAWSRLGSAYSPADLRDAQDDGGLVDLRGMMRPAEDIALFRAGMLRWRDGGDEFDGWRRQYHEWVMANDLCRREILDCLRDGGPLPARELPDSCVRPWGSSGWNDNRNRTMMLDMMVLRGEIAAAGWRGRDRLWDLADRVYPDCPVVPADEAERERNRRRLRALGIARERTTEAPIEPNDVGDVGEPAVVDGVRGEWRVDPELLDGPFEGRAALLSPLDRLVYDRARMADLFEFDYQLEMYKPAAKRKWGYWALPVLYGDRLVGKLDAAADHKHGTFVVNALHRDVPFTTAMTAAVDREITDLAAWLGLHLVRADRR